MFIKIWEWFWQKAADYHFYKWLRTKEEIELERYMISLDFKFFRRR